MFGTANLWAELVDTIHDHHAARQRSDQTRKRGHPVRIDPVDVHADRGRGRRPVRSPAAVGRLAHVHGRHNGRVRLPPVRRRQVDHWIRAGHMYRAVHGGLLVGRRARSRCLAGRDVPGQRQEQSRGYRFRHRVTGQRRTKLDILTRHRQLGRVRHVHRVLCH